MKENSKLSTLTRGIIKENPVLVLVLGTCPTLATSTSVSTAIGMGLAATIVLICSNIFISLLRKIIPDSVRIPCYIVVIAGFVSVVQMLVQAFMQDLYNALGVYLPLIVVNCIILGRAEMFALTLTVMATIREVLGSGSWYGIELPFFSTYNIPILTKPAGGFFVFGCMVALVAKLTHGKVKHTATGCASCPNAEACAKLAKEG